MALEWTQDEIDTLRAAVASGVLTVSYDGPPRRMVTYQSLAEMRRLLVEMQASVDQAAGTAASYIRVQTKKGFGCP
jgi:hypothetical protein